MDKEHSVVVQRDGKWWIAINGERRGPFELRKDAADAAITLAKTNEGAARFSAKSRELVGQRY